jgi:hypothetical protein
MDCTTPCDHADATSIATIASSSLPLIATAFEPRNMAVTELETSEHTKEKAEEATESETESEVSTEDNKCVDDDDCVFVSELLATADALLDDNRAVVSVCVDEEEDDDARSLPAVREDEEDARVVDTSDVSALLARILALKTDNQRLENKKELCRGIAFELEVLNAAAETHIAQMEDRIRLYGNQLTAAEARVTHLETTLYKSNQHYSGMETRIKELEPRCPATRSWRPAFASTTSSFRPLKLESPSWRRSCARRAKSRPLPMRASLS